MICVLHLGEQGNFETYLDFGKKEGKKKKTQKFGMYENELRTPVYVDLCNDHHHKVFSSHEHQD